MCVIEVEYLPVVAPKPKPEVVPPKVVEAVGAAVAVGAPPNENVDPGVVPPPNGPGVAPKLKLTANNNNEHGG